MERAHHAVEEANRCIAENQSEEAVQILETALGEGDWTGEVHAVLTHNLVNAYCGLIAACLKIGSVARAMHISGKAMRVPVPDDTPEELIRGRANAFTAMASAFHEAGFVDAEIPLQRKAIALYPCPTFSNNLISALAARRAPSVLTDYCDTLTLADIAPHILLACQPKSGSTFIKNIIAEATGFRDTYLFHAAELSAQDIFYPTLLEFADVPTVTHQHCRASEANLQILQAFGMRAVILTRSLYDVLISLSEFFTGGAIRGTQFDVDTWLRLPQERRLDQLIDLVVPWHLEFLASWQRADKENRLPILWLTYEEAMADKPTTIGKILDFYSVSVPVETINQAITSISAAPDSKNRKNKGVSGRGRENLTSDHKARIRRLTDYFPTTDFSPYGL